MTRNDNDESRSVALYWDFENLHAGLAEAKYGEGSYNKPDARFKPQEPLIDVQALVELGSSFGPIALNRAYCNWQSYGRYRDALLQERGRTDSVVPARSLSEERRRHQAVP